MKWALAIPDILLAVAAIILPSLYPGIYLKANEPDLELIKIIGLLTPFWAIPIAIVILVYSVVMWRVSRWRKGRE